MKILYALQGTGNGHVSRSREIIPILKQYGEVDVLISGSQYDFEPPCEVKYHKHGLSFGFDQKGGIGYYRSVLSAKPIRFIKDVMSFPIEGYDLVLNDFEPIVAWAARRKKIPCVAFGHQASLLSAKTPRPAKIDKFGELILSKLAPSTTAVGFNFDVYDDFIYTPVIHHGIRNAAVSNEGHYTIYLPAYHENYFIPYLHLLKKHRFEVFSKHTKVSYTKGNVLVRPVGHDYIKSLATSAGLITGGGFEAPAEAIFLGKKLLMIPMKGQYEQHCNAAAAATLGIEMLQGIEADFAIRLAYWINNAKTIHIPFPDKTAQIIDSIIKHNTIYKAGLIPEKEISPELIEA